MENNFVDMPYFMNNKKWFYFDFEDRKYKLTEYAPKKAKQSYEEFYKMINKG